MMETLKINKSDLSNIFRALDIYFNTNTFGQELCYLVGKPIEQLFDDCDYYDVYKLIEKMKFMDEIKNKKEEL